MVATIHANYCRRTRPRRDTDGRSSARQSSLALRVLRRHARTRGAALHSRRRCNDTRACMSHRAVFGSRRRALVALPWEGAQGALRCSCNGGLGLRPAETIIHGRAHHSEARQRAHATIARKDRVGRATRHRDKRRRPSLQDEGLKASNRAARDCSQQRQREVAGCIR